MGLPLGSVPTRSSVTSPAGCVERGVAEWEEEEEEKGVQSGTCMVEVGREEV